MVEKFNLSIFKRESQKGDYPWLHYFPRRKRELTIRKSQELSYHTNDFMCNIAANISDDVRTRSVSRQPECSRLPAEDRIPGKMLDQISLVSVTCAIENLRKRSRQVASILTSPDNIILYCIIKKSKVKQKRKP